MYFNDKNDTNIDNEFNNKNKFRKLSNNKTKKSGKNKSKKLFDKSMIPLVVFILLFVFGIVLLVIDKVNNSKYSIDLLGEEYITLYKGDSYVEPGYLGFNSKKKDISSQIIVDNQVDMDTVGEYIITYTLNNQIKSRYIKVIERPVGATYIYLYGDMDVYLDLGEKYVEPGYDVVDTIDGSIDEKVEINSNVNISKAGVYHVKYSVVNSSGVTTIAVRNVIVIDSDISLTLDNTGYTNKSINIKVYANDNYFNYMILPNGDKVTSKSYSYQVSENGEYKFTIYNKKGTSKEKTIKVSTINKTIPSGSCTGSYGNGKSIIKVNATDDIGISKYVINGNSYATNLITINSEMKNVSVDIYDKAGNTKTISCNLEKKVESSSGSGNNSDNVKSNKLEMHFIGSKGYYDDAILIRTDNKVIMIDGGSWGCRDYVTPYLRELGVKKIDAMFGSHLHYNHIQAQADLLDNFEVDKIYYPDDIYTCNSYGSCDSSDQKYILSAINNHGKTPVVLKPGQKITVGEMEIFVLAPEKIITGSYCQNANSFIFILKYYNNTFMFTGDAGASQLNGTKLKPYADRLGISLDVNLLKYPHHGNASLYDNFLSYIKPEYVVVPNYNKPSFPYSENVNMLNKYGVKMYRQSDSSNGNILVTSDGNNIKITMGVTASQYKR